MNIDCILKKLNDVFNDEKKAKDFMNVRYLLLKSTIFEDLYEFVLNAADKENKIVL